MPIILVLTLFDLSLRVFSPIPRRSSLDWVYDGHIIQTLGSNQLVRTGVGHNALGPYLRETEQYYRLNSLGFKGEEWTVDPEKLTILFFEFGLFS